MTSFDWSFCTKTALKKLKDPGLFSLVGLSFKVLVAKLGG